MKRKLLAAVLCIALTVSAAVPAYADRLSDLSASNAAAQEQLTDQEQSLAETEDAKAAVEAEISAINSDLVSLMVNIGALKTDIANTQGQITSTVVQLSKAVAEKDTQYNAMKTRIQYIYESGGDVTWAKYLL